MLTHLIPEFCSFKENLTLGFFILSQNNLLFICISDLNGVLCQHQGNFAMCFNLPCHYQFFKKITTMKKTKKTKILKTSTKVFKN